MIEKNKCVRIVRSCLLKLVAPIVDNLPFFIVSFVLLGGFEYFRNLHGRFVSFDPRVTILDICNKIILLFFVIYIITALVEIVSKKWFKIFAYGFIILIFSVDLFLQRQFNLHINPTVFVLLAETTSKESSEFVTTFMLSIDALKTYLIILSTPLIVFLLEYLYGKCNLKSFIKQKLSIYLAVLIAIVLLLGVCQIKNYYDLFKCDNTDTVSGWIDKGSSPKDLLSRCVYSTYAVNIMGKEQEESIQYNMSIDDDIKTLYNDSLNVVLIIGESYIKHHSHLYGYPLNNTPFMSTEKEKGRLFVFKDVVSPFNQTSATLKNILCTNSVSDGESWSKSAFFPMLYKMAGYDVYLWDNQKNMDSYATYSFALNGFIYNKDIMQRTYTSTNDNSFDYDEDIVTSFGKVKLKNKHNFVVFHLMGQHVNAGDRYPHTKLFQYFSSDSINRHEPYLNIQKKQDVAEYDNATRYNDYVLSLIVDRFKRSNAFIVYLSDHGDEIYDYRDSKGRIDDNMSKNQVKYQFEIPFMIWCSDSFIRRYPDKINLIRQSLNRPFMSDNLCHFMFDLSGIKTKYYNKERDLISPYFKARKRIIKYSYDYDLIMRK